TSGVEALLGALPTGLRRGSDTRGFLLSVVTDYDAASGRVLAAVGEESAWLLALAGAYTAGDLIAVLRNPWSGKAELVLGVLPAGTLTTDPPPATGPATEVVVRHDGPVRIITTYLANHQQGGS
ncbi:hypothetical protein, partial [Isoptericola hypogeus]|uniref:hypothetical protein n=1 Tax=Isoptericola hypogeus TaxID=300179 RepID=UPI0031D68A74